MNKKKLDQFIGELKEVFNNNLKHNSLSDLIRSADLFMDTLKKETPKFKKECKLNGKPGKGYCTNEGLYNDCLVSEYGKRMKNNWMCGRDGVLIG